MSHLKRFVGFALLPMLSFASAVLLLPLVSERFGASGLSALTVGQSIGAFVSVIVGLAWPVVGGQQVAVATDDVARRALFARSYATRALVLAVCAAPTALASALLVPQYHLEAAMFGVAIACNGLTSGWYFAGTGNPLPIVLYEGVTRLVAHAVALGGMALGLGMWVYAAAMLTWAPVMAWLNWAHVMRGHGESLLPSVQDTVELVRQQTLGTVSRLAQAGFGFGGPPVFAAFGPVSLANFSAADQIQKSATGGAFAVINAFVNWVGDGGRRGRRSLLAMTVCVMGSVVFFVVWIFAGSRVMAVVFSGEVRLTPAELALLGLSVVGVFLVRSTELLVMVPHGLERLVFQANTIVSLVGLLAMALVARQWGVSGGLTVVGLCSLVLIGIYGWGLFGQRRSASQVGHQGGRLVGLAPPGFGGGSDPREDDSSARSP